MSFGNSRKLNEVNLIKLVTHGVSLKKFKFVQAKLAKIKKLKFLQEKKK